MRSGTRLGPFVNHYAFLSPVMRLTATVTLSASHSSGDSSSSTCGGGCTRARFTSATAEDLEYDRLPRVSSGAISLEEDRGYVTTPTDVGTGDPEEEQAPLSEIIERLNERFGTDFTAEDRLFFEQVKQRAVRDEDIRQTALANTLEKFSLGIRPQIGKLMIQRMGDNDALVTRYMNDPEFQEIAFEGLARRIFEAVAAGESTARE